jgi:ATP-binding cassette subfamily B protein
VRASTADLVNLKPYARAGSLRDVLHHLPAFIKLVSKSGRGMALGGLLLVLLQSPVPTLQLFVTQKITDLLVSSVNFPHSSFWEALSRFWPFVVGGLLLALLGQGMAQVQGLVLGLLGQRVSQHLNRQIMETAAEIEYSQFDHPALYDRLQRAQQDASARAPQLLGLLLNLLQQSLVTVSLIAVILRLEAVMAVLLVASVVPQVVMLSRMAQRNFRVMWGQMPLARRMSYIATLLTSRDAAKEVRLFRLKDHLIEEHNVLFKEQYNRLRSMNGKRILAVVVLGALAALAYASVIALLVWRVSQGRLTLGEFVFASGAFIACQSGVVNVVGLFVQLYESMLFLDNVYAFVGKKQGPGETPQPLPLAVPAGSSIEFKNVSFQYPGQQHDALKEINLRIRPGEIVAVVGENGAGKTTLIKLLTSLYNPSRGEILIDGVAIIPGDEEATRRKIAVIYQDYVCYWASVEENIGYGNIEQIECAAEIQLTGKKSGVDRFTLELPGQYQTILSQFAEAGAQLSQGQWQRVALGRALFHQGSILVLDEPTASLDPSSEYEIFGELRNLAAGRTVIMISHRFSTVRRADRIFVLAGGSITESGGHDELLAMKGQYAKMFNIQAMGYR